MATQKTTYKEGDRVRIDGITCVVRDVLSAQLFVEWETGGEPLHSFILLNGGHKIEVENDTGAGD